MNDHGKSDRRVVPTKRPNNDQRGQTTRVPEEPETPVVEPSEWAEAVEGSRLAKGNSLQRPMLRTQGRVGRSPELERVRQAAKQDRKMRFTARLHHGYRLDTLRAAYLRLKRSAAPGIDGVTWQQYGEHLEANRQDLAIRLKRGAYRAQPTRRSYSPKADGQRRPLGVTALEDKMVPSALGEVLNAIYEVEFLGFSYGSRPGRSQHDALDALWMGIARSKVNWVRDADIRGFYDAMRHEWLVKFIEHRIADRRVVRLIQKWLTAGVLEDGQIKASEVGSPQGASFSPLAANIYLHYVFALWAHRWRQQHCRGDVRIVRYVDGTPVQA